MQRSQITSNMFLVTGASPFWTGLLGSSCKGLGLIRLCSKSEEPAKSPAAVRGKGLAVNSAARGESNEGVLGTSSTTFRSTSICGSCRKGRGRGTCFRGRILLKPPGRGCGGVVGRAAAGTEITCCTTMEDEVSGLCGLISFRDGGSSMIEVSCFLLDSFPALDISPNLTAVTGICSGSAVHSLCSLSSSDSLLGDHRTSGGAEEGPGVTAPKVDI